MISLPSIGWVNVSNAMREKKEATLHGGWNAASSGRNLIPVASTKGRATQFEQAQSEKPGIYNRKVGPRASPRVGGEYPKFRIGRVVIPIKSSAPCLAGMSVRYDSSGKVPHAFPIAKETAVIEAYRDDGGNL